VLGSSASGARRGLRPLRGGSWAMRCAEVRRHGVRGRASEREIKPVSDSEAAILLF